MTAFLVLPAPFFFRCSVWARQAASMGFILLALGLVLGLNGCSKSEATPGVGQRPSRLRVGWSNTNDEEPDRRVRYEGLAKYLSKKLNMPVDMIETGQYSAQIEGFRARKIEIGNLSPFSYVIAREKAPVEPLVTRGSANGDHSNYRSVLIVPPNSPLRTIEDLKKSAKNLTLAWVDPASTSGHLIPRAYLESIGMNPEKDFKQVIFTQSHLATAMTIKSGKVDVAASMNTGLKRLVDKGRIGPHDYRVIWESEGVINDIQAIRSDLPEDFKEEVRRAYLAFPSEAPEAWAKYKARMPDPSLVWVRAKDSDLDGVRAIARRVKHIQLLE